ncbi:MAG: hypothetical protein UR98_C0038G0005 [Parcubacteria group bacterium GW2011_GWA1_36_12]|nr:MAG: hypothetical protein UR98_C0038G0005 [Parcubacteria group bacterium GW2011_GWA1_36_12]
MKKVKGIEINPEIMFGKPVIAGTRIPVYLILDLLADGITKEEIIEDYYPSLTEKDIRSALKYGAKVIRNEEIKFVEKPEKSRIASL